MKEQDANPGKERDARRGDDPVAERKEGQPKKAKGIDIEVNGRAVQMTEKEATGAEIKRAAIAQGVAIQPNFMLQQELANGSSRVIGDTDEVRLHEKLSFTAIAPDDNS
jgi:hypothetical protein